MRLFIGVSVERTDGRDGSHVIYFANGGFFRTKAINRWRFDGMGFVTVGVIAYPVTVMEWPIVVLALITDNVDSDVVSHAIGDVAPTRLVIIKRHLITMAKDINGYIVVDVTEALYYSQVIWREVRVDNYERICVVFLIP